MGQMGPAPVRAPEGEMPIGEAHSHPPDLPDLQAQVSTVREQGFVDPKAHVCAHQARRVVLDEGVRMRPNPWPNLGIVNASHAPPPYHTPAALGAPDEEEEALRITSPRRRRRGHAIWLPKQPPRGCNVWAHNPDSSKPDTHACEDWRLSLDVDAQDHPIAEQGAQVASAALARGGGNEEAGQEQ